MTPPSSQSSAPRASTHRSLTTFDVVLVCLVIAVVVAVAFGAISS